MTSVILCLVFCFVFLLVTAPWCNSSILGEILQMIPVPWKTALTEEVVFEDRDNSCLQIDHGQRISLATEEETRMSERRVKLRGLVVTEESSLKMERIQQIISKDIPVKDIPVDAGPEPAYIQYVDTKPCEEEHLDLKEDAGNQRVDSSLRSVSPPVKKVTSLPSKTDITPAAQKIHPSEEEAPASEFESKKEAYKKIPPESKLYTEITESCVSVHQDLEAEVVLPLEDLDESKTPFTPSIVSVSKSSAAKNVTVVKQVSSIEEAPTGRFLSSPLKETVLPPCMIPSNEEALPPKTMTSPREEIINTSKTTEQMHLEDSASVEKPTAITQILLRKEASSVPASRKVSPPVLAEIPSPEKTVCLEEDVILLEDTKSKETFPTLPKEVVMDVLLEEVTESKKPVHKDGVAPSKISQVLPEKKLLPPEQEAPKKPASYTPKGVTSDLDSSEEARTTATKFVPTRDDDKKAKKGTEETDQQALQKGILYS